MSFDRAPENVFWWKNIKNLIEQQKMEMNDDFRYMNDDLWPSEQGWWTMSLPMYENMGIELE